MERTIHCNCIANLAVQFFFFSFLNFCELVLLLLAFGAAVAGYMATTTNWIAFITTTAPFWKTTKPSRCTMPCRSHKNEIAVPLMIIGTGQPAVDFTRITRGCTEINRNYSANSIEIVRHLQYPAKVLRPNRIRSPSAIDHIGMSAQLDFPAHNRQWLQRRRQMRNQFGPTLESSPSVCSCIDRRSKCTQCSMRHQLHWCESLANHSKSHQTGPPLQFWENCQQNKLVHARRSVHDGGTYMTRPPKNGSTENPFVDLFLRMSLQMTAPLRKWPKVTSDAALAILSRCGSKRMAICSILIALWLRVWSGVARRSIATGNQREKIKLWRTDATHSTLEFPYRNNFISLRFSDKNLIADKLKSFTKNLDIYESRTVFRRRYLVTSNIEKHKRHERNSKFQPINFTPHWIFDVYRRRTNLS